ncbi:MAG: zf-HC2 domain-containing protein [Nitrospira sp.]|nr:zf-HC2 domain-containing protein [Nitrospira sp.]
MNKECELIQENLSAYQDGELTQEKLSALHEHLSTCRNCQSLIEEYARMGHLLREQMAQQVAGVNLTSLREKVLEQITPAAHLRQTRRIGLDIRRYRWRVVWAFGLAMAIMLIWLGPNLWEIKDQSRQTVFNGSTQEQLGRAIRDAAGVRFTVGQKTTHYQEQLGQLIRDNSRGGVQEQLGLLIRDHARSQWVINQQWGQLQEKIGMLIQSHARQQTS